MAKDPKKKPAAKKPKRKESAQEHVKRSQASKRRIRAKGRFTATGVHKAQGPGRPHHTDPEDYLRQVDNEAQKVREARAKRQQKGPGNSARPVEWDEQVRLKNRAKAANTNVPPRTAAPRTPRTKTNEFGKPDRLAAMENPNNVFEGSAYRGDPTGLGSERRSGADVNEDRDGFMEKGANPRKATGGGPRVMEKSHGEFQLDTAEQFTRQIMATGAHPDDAKRVAHQMAAELTASTYGKATRPEVAMKVNDPILKHFDADEFRGETREELRDRVDTDQLWADHRGTMNTSSVPDENTPLRLDRGRQRHSTEEIMRKLPASQQDWVSNQMESGIFAGDNGFRELEDYLAMAHDNFAHKEIMEWRNMGKPDSLSSRGGTKQSSSYDEMRGQAEKDMTQRKYGSQTTSKDKYASGTGSHSSFSYSKQAVGVDSIESLRKQYPDMSMGDLVRLNHAQRQTVTEHMLEQNERWAHESRMARVNKSGDQGDLEKNDRVVFLTTNVGAPALSVDSNSTVGQYIIKKRKKMVVDDKIATRQQVKGAFPKAVRDQHIIEVGTGISLGIEGRGGVFHNTGWKKGSKRSKGYGNKAPVGASVLRDSAGQPIFDKDGNVRYTEGYTRPFQVGTDKNVGLRIFIG